MTNFIVRDKTTNVPLKDAEISTTPFLTLLPPSVTTNVEGWAQANLLPLPCQLSVRKAGYRPITVPLIGFSLPWATINIKLEKA